VDRDQVVERTGLLRREMEFGGSRVLMLSMLNCFQMYCDWVSLMAPARFAASQP
jgi:hypothetical protein